VCAFDGNDVSGLGGRIDAKRDLGYGLAVTVYLMAQSLTGFRHYLHGALLAFFLAALYALLIPAIAKAS
jgi:hypothetical protein